MWRGARGTADYEPSLPIFPRHLDLSVTVLIQEERVIGKCVVHCVARRADRVLVLHAVDFLRTEVKCEEHPCEWTYDGEEITIVWPEALELDTKVEVTVEYVVQSPPKALVFSNPDEFHPQRSRFVVSDHETERARYWIPCVDNPLVRMTAEFHITTARDLTVLASGTFVGEGEPQEMHGEEMVTRHWRLETPTPSYLLSMAVGEFEEVQMEPVGDTRLSVFTSRDNRPLETLKPTFGQTRNAMLWLTEKLGVQFPLPNYFQIALYGLCGAMENNTVVTWDDFWLVTEETRQERWQILDRIILHEMSHVIAFGNMVVVRHFAHAWLKEGWAHYMECVYLEDRCGRAAFEAELCESAGNYMQECKKYMRPIVTREFEHSFQMFDKHLYPGSAWRIHMLRRHMGDETFWNMARTWIERYSGKAVETAHFRLHCEEMCKDPLARFFDQWIYGVGYPRLACTYEFDVVEGMVTIEARQTQIGQDGQGFFDMDLEVLIVCRDGSEISRTLSFDRTVRSSGIALLQVPLSESPVAIYFDPSMSWLFSLQFDLPTAMLATMVGSAPDVRSRLWAFEMLLLHGRGESLTVAKGAAVTETVWEIRLAMFRLLAKRETRFIPFMIEMMRREQEPQAVWRMLYECTMKDARLREFLVGAINGGELLPNGRRYALRALGHQQDERDLVLMNGVFERDTTFHQLARRGVLEGLGFMRSPAALDFLLARAAYGVLNVRIRDVCVRSIGQCGSVLSDRYLRRARETVVPLLHDPVYDVRQAAVDALVMLKASGSAHLVAYTRSSFAAQDHPWLDRQLAALSRFSDKKTNIKTLETKLSKMQSKMWQMQQAIERLEAWRRDDDEGTSFTDEDGDDDDGVDH